MAAERPETRLAPGPSVAVSVDDDGAGMPPEILARVMELFFTVKPEGEGTRLGLAVVYGFSKQSGGTVEIGSVVGRGSTVTLLFTVAQEADPGAVARRRPRPWPAGEHRGGFVGAAGEPATDRFRILVPQTSSRLSRVRMPNAFNREIVT